MTLAQAANGPLAGLEGNTRFAVGAAFILVAGAVAWQAARTRDFGPAIAYWIGGLVVASAMGFLFGDVALALFMGSLYVVLAAGAQMFALAREDWEIGFWGVFAAVGLVGIMALADLKTAAFVVSAGVIVGAAIKTLQTTKLVHAALWLAGVLVGIAVIFLSLGAEFLAAIQILVYVGAVVTLFLFTVMLTVPAEEVHGLKDLQVPPGLRIEDASDLNPATPAYGMGPYKGLADTNPRKPVRSPDSLYGVALTDGVYGTKDTVRRKSQKEQEEK